MVFQQNKIRFFNRTLKNNKTGLLCLTSFIFLVLGRNKTLIKELSRKKLLFHQESCKVQLRYINRQKIVLPCTNDVTKPGNEMSTSKQSISGQSENRTFQP